MIVCMPDRVPIMALIEFAKQQGLDLRVVNQEEIVLREKPRPENVRFLRARNDNPTFQGPGAA